MMANDVQNHFDAIAGEYDRWKQRAHYYYRSLQQALSDLIPPGSSVLEVGCGTGDVLASLQPSMGLGSDLSAEMVKRAQEKFPYLNFVQNDISASPVTEQPYDYVVAADVFEHVSDIKAAFRNMRSSLASQGRLIIVTANPSWAPILHLAEILHLKMPEGEHTWRSQAALVAAAADAGLSIESFTRRLLVPKRIPVLHRINDSRRTKKLVERWGLMQIAVFRQSD